MILVLNKIIVEFLNKLKSFIFLINNIKDTINIQKDIYKKKQINKINYFILYYKT